MDTLGLAYDAKVTQTINLRLPEPGSGQADLKSRPRGQDCSQALSSSPSSFSQSTPTPARRTLGCTADLMSDVEDGLKRDATWLSPEEKRRSVARLSTMLLATCRERHDEHLSLIHI